jgi:hypothetical protein
MTINLPVSQPASQPAISRHVVMKELQWKAVEIEDPDNAGTAGAAAIAHDISLRVWFNDNSKLRIRGQVALQQNKDGEFRIAYYGQQVAFDTGDQLGCDISSNLQLPDPREWILPKAAKVAGRHTRGRVLVIGFSSGVMFKKLQVVFKITDDHDHGKFFIKTIESIQRDAHN